MDTLSQFFHDVAKQLSEANFPLLLLIDLSAFGALFVIALLACIFSDRVRSHGKRAYLSAVNAFSAVTLAIFLTEFAIEQALAVTACFWLLGFLLYGVLCLFKENAQPDEGVKTQLQQVHQAHGVQSMSTGVQGMPINSARVQSANQPAPTAQTGVRLEHALSIADKLLLKNLGRGDRQELEKMKTALTVLKVKGILSVQEGEALNEMFNALLKLMAKYDL